MIQQLKKFKRFLRYLYLCSRVLGLKGLWYTIKAKFANTVIFYNLDKYGCNFTLRIPSVDDVCIAKEIFINRVYDFLTETEPEVVVDAGANTGLAAIYFANRYTKARIIAIEPEQGNFDLLKKNVEPYPNIIPVQAALWNKNEEIDLIDPGLGTLGFMTRKDNSSKMLSGDTLHKVTAMTVDKIMDDYHLDRINILKIDIEGAEKEVFSDTSSWIDKVDSIVIELHDRMKAGCCRSFYCGSDGFDNEWQQGENICLSRGNYLAPGRTFTGKTTNQLI